MFQSLLILCCWFSQGTPVANPPRFDPVLAQARSAAFLSESHAVGMAVAVFDRGELVFESALGLRDREAQLACEKNTLFRLASVSKPVTAVLALQLVEEQRCQLDAALSSKLSDLPSAWQPLNLRQLLSHTSGIRHYRADRLEFGLKTLSTRQALESFAADPLVAPAGTKYSYSTHAFTLAALLIEELGQAPLPTQLRERISKPYAASLDCELSSATKPERSQLYEKREDGSVIHASLRENLSWKYAGGGMESTAADLARFAEALRSAKLLRAATRDLAWTPTRLADGSSTEYGLGFRLDPENSLISHTGSQQGASAALLIDRQRERIVVVLINTKGIEALRLAHELRRL